MVKNCPECSKPIDENRTYCSNTCTQKACRRRKKNNNKCVSCSIDLPSGSYCQRCLDIARIKNKASFDKNYRLRPRYHNLLAKMLTSARIRARKKNIEFTITIDDLEISEKCPVLGYVMEQNIGKPKANSPTIDRVDNTKGYIPGNVAVISYRANCLKRDSSLAELIKLVDYVKSYQKENHANL